MSNVKCLKSDVKSLMSYIVICPLTFDLCLPLPLSVSKEFFHLNLPLQLHQAIE